MGLAQNLLREGQAVMLRKSVSKWPGVREGGPRGRDGGKGKSWPPGLPVWPCSKGTISHPTNPPSESTLPCAPTAPAQAAYPAVAPGSSHPSSLSAGLCCPPRALPGSLWLEAPQWFLMCTVQLPILAFRLFPIGVSYAATAHAP